MKLSLKGNATFLLMEEVEMLALNESPPISAGK